MAEQRRTRTRPSTEAPRPRRAAARIGPEEAAQGACRRLEGLIRHTAEGVSAVAARFLDDVRRLGGVTVSQRTVEDVQLVVTELAANAAKYAPGPCLLDLEADGEAVRVTLWDTEAVLPSPRRHDALRIGGHGLELVVALCDRVEIERYAGGKRIRASVPLRRG